MAVGAYDDGVLETGDGDVLVLCPNDAIAHVVAERDAAHHHVALRIGAADAQQRVPRADIIPRKGAPNHRQTLCALEYRDIDGNRFDGREESWRIAAGQG